MMTWNSMFFNSPSSLLMEVVVSMHDYVMLFLTGTLIMTIVTILNTMTIKSFNLEFYENHQLENIWTFMPFIMLILILIPSLNSLYMLDSCIFCGLNISITGHQWYWSYAMKDLKNFLFDSYMKPVSKSTIRLLETDNILSIPTNIPIRFLVSSADVIHSWTIPSFGVKMDAIPGRLNQFCFSTKRSGIYFGQCSEICGANHSFMPIVLESVKLNNFLKMS